MKAKAEKSAGSSHGSIYRSVIRILEGVIGEKGLAFLPKHMLGKGLAGVFRVKTGRQRIFYIASTELGVATILYFGYRKAGHNGDAYEELTKLIRRGKFDALFEELGTARPKC